MLHKQAGIGSLDLCRYLMKQLATTAALRNGLLGIIYECDSSAEKHILSPELDLPESS